MNKIIDFLNEKYIRRNDVLYKNEYLERYINRYNKMSYFARRSENEVSPVSYEEASDLYDFYNKPKILYIGRKRNAGRQGSYRGYGDVDPFSTSSPYGQYNPYGSNGHFSPSDPYYNNQYQNRRNRNKKPPLKLIFAIAGAVATVIGGSLADKFGFTQWTRFVSVLGVPFATCFLFTQNPILALLFLTCYALFYYGAMSPIVIIGQKLLPLHVGMATGITIGLGISFGGITAPLLGRLGDNFGLEATMQAIVFLVAISAVLSFLVPIVNRPQKA